MSNFKVGDKLVALESVKKVRNCIPQQQLDMMTKVVLTVKNVNTNSFSVVFHGYSGSPDFVWWFSLEDYARHFVKLPSPGDVVTKLVIPGGKSLRGINLCDTNPAGRTVRSSGPRENHPWSPQDVYLSDGYFWPVSWLRFRYNDGQDEVAEVKFKVGDKVRFKSRIKSQLKGEWTPQNLWCDENSWWGNLQDDHVFTVEEAPYLPQDCGYPRQELVIGSPETGGGWYTFACDVVLVKDDEDACSSGSKAEDAKPVKLTKQQKSAKKLAKHVCKAQIEARTLRDASPGGSIGSVNVTDFVCSLHKPKRVVRQIAGELGIELEKWQEDC